MTATVMVGVAMMTQTFLHAPVRFARSSLAAGDSPNVTHSDSPCLLRQDLRRHEGWPAAPNSLSHPRWLTGTAGRT